MSQIFEVPCNTNNEISVTIDFVNMQYCALHRTSFDVPTLESVEVILTEDSVDKHAYYEIGGFSIMRQGQLLNSKLPAGDYLVYRATGDHLSMVLRHIPK